MGMNHEGKTAMCFVMKQYYKQFQISFIFCFISIHFARNALCQGTGLDKIPLSCYANE